MGKKSTPKRILSLNRNTELYNFQVTEQNYLNVYINKSCLSMPTLKLFWNWYVYAVFLEKEIYTVVKISNFKVAYLKQGYALELSHMKPNLE